MKNLNTWIKINLRSIKLFLEIDRKGDTIPVNILIVVGGQSFLATLISLTCWLPMEIENYEIIILFLHHLSTTHAKHRRLIRHVNRDFVCWNFNISPTWCDLLRCDVIDVHSIVWSCIGLPLLHHHRHIHGITWPHLAWPHVMHVHILIRCAWLQDRAAMDTMDESESSSESAPCDFYDYDPNDQNL